MLGITFNVYGHGDGVEKVWPMDILPRVIDAGEWAMIETGLKQRIRALNLFLDDIYGEQQIIADGILPADLIETATSFREVCRGQRPPHGVWTHITGTDLIRHGDGTIYVLEDNLRCPSGVSYVLENREVMKRVLPEVFSGVRVSPVEDYPELLLKTLIETAPDGVDNPTVAVLTPGVYNSAYFEHCFLAQQMGVELVCGDDLIVDDGVVKMQTTKGLQQVDVIYRRIDDDFLDPSCFREDSMLGVPGLMQVYRDGRVTLANAPGNGVADDKAVYAYVPQIIQFYLGEEPILANVPTYICADVEQRQYVLDHLDALVVKPTNESGGYGIVLGPESSREELDQCAESIQKDPRNFIAQPMLCLSTVPTITDKGPAPRHVDLRPFILYGRDIQVMPGGLTRVALREGSMVVNSSQGGGSKDTWVLK
ncbi:MAG: circularly permuted type 2 ATP-grasp protein [Planctomycetaceae bacterium]|nr:circularly permuted type 2 ATP-grasp protein [Planctomycetaceae bacterium]